MPTSLQYHRLRAPRDNGQTLQDPPLESAGQLLRDNLQINRAEVLVDERPLDELMLLGRREVAELALQHTSSYRDVSHFVESAQETDPIIMSGHQPTLFHPGVWYKNFALSELGSRLNCVAINLIVDNDICGVASIQVPVVGDGDAAFGLLPIDAAADNVPFEARAIEDPSVFDGFAGRVEHAMKDYVQRPIVTELWKHAIEFRKQDNRLGQTLATSRHAIELGFGLKTLEVPLSQVAQTHAFAHFAKHLLSNLTRFQEIHNTTLAQYRRVHKIRSRSHPVPALESDGPWLEAPLWIWDFANPLRGRLFAKVTDDKIAITDRKRLEVELDRANFVEQFSDLTSKRGIAVRPRALTTTMFCRIVLSDMFLHGIGGAKYDQLTDQIIEQFLGLQPPRFMTLTATLKLPTHDANVHPADAIQIKGRLRDLVYHPETHLLDPDPNSQEIVRQKMEWIEQRPPKGAGHQRHVEITRCNEQLQPYVDAERARLLENQIEMARKVRTGRVLGSREFSFCLFPHELMPQLKQLAK